MKKMKHRVTLFLAACAAMVAMACSEEVPQAYDGEEPVVSASILPQGNHDYDARLAEMYDRLGVIPMYIFTDKDWCWSVTNDIHMHYDAGKDVDYGGYRLVQADERYVGEQLELLEGEVLNFFPDSLLRDILPQKMLLASDIIHNTGSLNGPLAEEDYVHEYSYSGYGYVAFSMGSEQVLSITDEQRRGYRLAGVKMLLIRGIESGQIAVDSHFSSVTDYSLSYASTRDANQAGMFNEYYVTPQLDWKYYVQQIISTPYNILLGQYLNKYPNMRKKYDIVVQYFMEHYGMDLQSIGNG